jgi:4-amino-4-deoxy-L-arabinose transferase-like glycosyltransferase
MAVFFVVLLLTIGFLVALALAFTIGLGVGLGVGLEVAAKVVLVEAIIATATIIESTRPLIRDSI